jgi:hypothetical protein
MGISESLVRFTTWRISTEGFQDILNFSQNVGQTLILGTQIPSQISRLLLVHLNWRQLRQNHLSQQRSNPAMAWVILLPAELGTRSCQLIWRDIQGAGSINPKKKSAVIVMTRELFAGRLSRLYTMTRGSLYAVPARVPWMGLQISHNPATFHTRRKGAGRFKQLSRICPRSSSSRWYQIRSCSTVGAIECIACNPTLCSIYHV